MKDYKFDYRRSSFKTIHKANKKIFYLQVNDQYVEVDEEVYKVCKASYDKIRYTHKVEVAKSVMYCDNMDLTTLFICDKAHDDIDKLYIHDLYQVAMNCIKELSKLDKIIAELSLIEEMSNYQIAELLNIPRTTITYKRNKIQNIFKKKQKNIQYLKIEINI